MRLFLAIIAVLLVPCCAFFVATLPYTEQLGFTNPLNIASEMTSCVSGALLDQSRNFYCYDLKYHNLLGVTALGVGAVGLGLVFFITGAGFLVGGNRVALAHVFRSVTFMSLLIMSVIMTLQGLMLVAALILATGTIVWYLVIVGLSMACFVGYVSASSLGDMFQNSNMSVAGLPLASDSGVSIRKMVDEVARSLNISPPENIIVGLEPTFFVTSSPVVTPFEDRTLKGETLFLSLSLMRVLSVEEIRSIIGHEFGHFTGKDTAYSKRFAPAYMGLYQAQAKLMQQENGWLTAAALPSRAIISFILATFQPAERKIGREREFRADKIGASVGSAQGLSSSLVKLAALAEVWNIEVDDLVARVQHGRTSRNLARNFIDRGRYSIDFDSMHEFTTASLNSGVAHPIDTHPLTSVRLEALGVDPEPLIDPTNFAASLFPADTLSDRCSDIEELEEKVSAQFQAHVRRLVQVNQTEENLAYTEYAEFLSKCLAKMVTIDGHVDDDEMFVAQKQAYEYDQAFDGTSFREHCRHPEDIPDLDSLIAYGNKALNVQGAARLKKILQDVANADGVIDPAEKDLLDRFEVDLQGSDEPVMEASQDASDAVSEPTSKRRRRR